MQVARQPASTAKKARNVSNSNLQPAVDFRSLFPDLKSLVSCLWWLQRVWKSEKRTQHLCASQDEQRSPTNVIHRATASLDQERRQKRAFHSSGRAALPCTGLVDTPERVWKPTFLKCSWGQTQPTVETPVCHAEIKQQQLDSLRSRGP